MKFFEKLNSLLNLFGITNYQLAEALQVDVSLISRWRTGNRLPSERSRHLEDISKLIVDKASEKEMLSDLIEHLGLSLSSASGDTVTIEDHLIQWLKDETPVKNSSLIKNLIEKIEFFGIDHGDHDLKGTADIDDFLITSDYVGLEGKREGIKRFLFETSLLEPTNIYLFSDEPLSWLIDDVNFYFSWTQLLNKVLQRGHRFILVHSVEGELEDILGAIEKWLPIYMHGNLESYYYPTESWGPFRQTLMIAGESLALTSASLDNRSGSQINYYITDKTKVKSLIETFYGLIEKCQPLLKVFTDKNRTEYFKELLDAEAIFSDTCTFSQSLSSITMPVSVIRDVHENAGWMKDSAESFLLKRQELFFECLKYNRYIEILSLPSVEEIISGKVMIDLSHFFPDGPLSYNLSDYKRHLCNIITLLETYENYSVILLDRKLFKDIKILVRKDAFSIISRYKPRPVTISFKYNGINKGLFDYINEKTKEADQKAYDKEVVLAKLKEFLKALDQ